MVTSPLAASWDWPVLDEEEDAMPGGDRQRIYISYITQVLRWWFAERNDVYVSGNLLLRYDPLKPGVAPDAVVIFGISSEDGDRYATFEEGGRAPDWVLEITSESTVKRDKLDKLELYRQLQVQEYFQYDPAGKYLKPASLRGFALVNGKYQPIAPAIQEAGVLCFRSQVLGLELRLLPEGLRLYDPATGDRLLTYEESHAARQQKGRGTWIDFGSPSPCLGEGVGG